MNFTWTTDCGGWSRILVYVMGWNFKNTKFHLLILNDFYDNQLCLRNKNDCHLPAHMCVTIDKYLHRQRLVENLDYILSFSFLK